MAKGEGAEQYSNASLLNKPGNSDGIQLAKRVSKFIYSKFSFRYGLILAGFTRILENRKGQALIGMGVDHLNEWVIPAS